MRKMEFETDNKTVENFLEELQQKLPQYTITLDNANDFAVMLEEKEKCKKCFGLNMCENINPGYCSSYEDGQFTFKECIFKSEMKVKNNKESLIKTLYLSNKILDARLENFDTNTESRRKIYSKIADFLSIVDTKEKKKGFYLYGGFSKGKTYTLGCIANELAKNNVSSLLIYFPDLVVDLKNAIGTERFELLINMLKSIDVLMLDDLGSENMTPWLRDEILGPIINYRLLENKPVFISSNLSPEQLELHLAIDKAPASQLKAQRLFSRLKALVNSVSMDDSITYQR